MTADRRSPLLMDALDRLLSKFAPGSATEGEVAKLDEFRHALDLEAPAPELDRRLRELSFEGYLRGALVALAEHLRRTPEPKTVLMLGRELLDAIDVPLGLDVVRSILGGGRKHDSNPTFIEASLLLGEAQLDQQQPAEALRHFEAVLSLDIDHVRALRGWGTAARSLDRTRANPASRGIALLEGIEEVELAGTGMERYELIRPLGRGRHGVVYQAHDRRVGREVAIKRLLSDRSRAGQLASRLVEQRFFAEAKTLARVRSPHVVALLDAQPRHRFIALEFCRGGNLRLALRKGLVDGGDIPTLAVQLRAALAAVHQAGAVHRDVKPANILLRNPDASSIALADFGLAIFHRAGQQLAGTLRYLAPEVRGGQSASPAADLFGSGVVLLELALAPTALPQEFDRPNPPKDAPGFVPDTVPEPWKSTLRRLLSDDPEARRW